MANEKKIKITKDGPYIVCGDLPLIQEIIETDAKDTPIKWVKGKIYPTSETYALCRCGKSKNMPFCDGAHSEIKFEGTETAVRRNYLDCAEKTEGPGLDLTDAEKLCSTARFCHRAGGIWRLVEKSDAPKLKAIAIKEACDCPAGRLVVWDKNSKKPIEPSFEPSISLIEDPSANASGPIWIKGGVPIESADGFLYEIRNRVTLCRCGKSKNKPLCDGRHVTSKFNDGDELLNKKK